MAGALTGLGYEVHHGKANGDPRLWLVTGWTTPIAMSQEAIDEWNVRMSELGLEHDAEFDGWGTTPEQ